MEFVPNTSWDFDTLWFFVIPLVAYIGFQVVFGAFGRSHEHLEKELEELKAKNKRTTESSHVDSAVRREKIRSAERAPKPSSASFSASSTPPMKVVTPKASSVNEAPVFDVPQDFQLSEYRSAARE